MSPKKPRVRPGDRTTARTRYRIARKYIDVAQLLEEDDGASINACIGNAVLSGIAAGDAIGLAAVEERYAGQNHVEAARFLSQIDAESGKQLRDLVNLKTAAHYGDQLLGPAERKLALRRANALVNTAKMRTA